MRERQRLERSQERQAHIAEIRRRRAIIQAACAVAAVGFIVLAIVLFMMTRTYHNYKVVRSSDSEDVISTKYVEMGGKILRYSPDGASLLNSKLANIWSVTFKMENPYADVCNNAAVIADIDGNSMEIFDKNGHTGSVTTSYGIVKARVSSKGLVAAILDGGDDTWINFYTKEGELIAENQTKIDDPGYPLDIAISDNGVIMMVAYQFIDGGDTTSYVAFYNFGEVGQNEDDKIVSGYTYEGTIVPQIESLNGHRAVAVRDDGFSIYSGKEIPKEIEAIKVDKEIISTFYDDDLVGLVFISDNENSQYRMEVYSTSTGKQKMTKEFHTPYTNIKVSDGNIIMYNNSQITVVKPNGTLRFDGNVDGTIKNVFKIGMNRYFLVLDNGISVIKFK